MVNNPIDKAIKRMEKDLEYSLNEDFTLLVRDWKVEIGFRGGFDEEWFSVSAYSSKLDNGVDFDTYVKPDFDTDLTQKQYDREVANLMEMSLDSIGMELNDRINEEIHDFPEGGGLHLHR